MGHDYDKYDDNCVLDILLDIVEAQEKAEDKNDCVTGCRTSIKELYRGKERAAAHTTIPVSLVCSGTCDYFVGMV